MSRRTVLASVLFCNCLLTHSAPFAHITNQRSHDVSVIDRPLGKVVATVPVACSPAGVVAASAVSTVFVSNPDSKTISLIDMRSQTVVDTLSAGAGPVGIETSKDGSTLIVSDWYRNCPLVFDTRRRDGAAKELCVGKAPAGVAFAGDGQTVHVAERDDESVAMIDRRTQAVKGRVKVGSHPFALLLDEECARLYTLNALDVLNVLSDDVSVVELRSLRVMASLKVGRAPYGAALAANNSLLYVTNLHGNTVSVIDGNSRELLRTLEGFANPQGVASHGDPVFVLNWMVDCVSVLDAVTGRELVRISSGLNSHGFGAFIGAPPTL